MTEDSWMYKVAQYRQEEPIVTVLQQVNNPKFVVDTTIHTELKNYFIFVQKSEMKQRSIRGPADYVTALEIFEEVQTIKDRVAEIVMTNQRIYKDIERLWDIAKIHLLLKPEVSTAKSDTIRYAIISKTVYEVEEVMSVLKSVLNSAELLVKNLNQTYNITHSQVETVKQMVYWRSLTLPTDKPSNILHDKA